MIDGKEERVTAKIAVAFVMVSTNVLTTADDDISCVEKVNSHVVE